MQGRAQSRVRGMLLGMALGETLGTFRGEPPSGGPLRAGVATQLACFTVEGSIRALVRGKHKGICHPPSVLWHAYSRWAVLQNIERDRIRARWASSAGEWPDGWLARVPALAERRGSAPATVAALTKIEQGTVERPTTGSRGWHALARTLPVAVVGTGSSAPGRLHRARETAALTHGDPAAQSAAAHGVRLAWECLEGEKVRDALEAGISALRADDSSSTRDEHRQLAAALRAAVDRPADAEQLALLAPDATAPSALMGGLYAAASFPLRAQIGEALRLAAGAPDGEAVACVTGALLGSVYGIEALPVDLVSRHELAWVLDALARDLLTEIHDSPSGSEYVAGWDPYWWERYPGW